MYKDLDSDSQLTFYSFEDIAKRPLFRAEIDTSKSKIDKLIATYHFPDKQPCGKKAVINPITSLSYGAVIAMLSLFLLSNHLYNLYTIIN